MLWRVLLSCKHIPLVEGAAVCSKQACASISTRYGSLREIFEFILQQQEQLVKVAISRLKNKLLKPNQATGFSITEHGRNIAGAEIHHKPLFCVRAILECVVSVHRTCIALTSLDVFLFLFVPAAINVLPGSLFGPCD
jgi:hypothetical protein